MITDRRRLALGLAALAAFFCLGLLPGGAEAQVSALPIDFSDVAIFATNSIRIDNGAQVTSGHVVVNNASSGPTLSPGVELRLGNNVQTSSGFAIVADSIQIGNGAVVGGNAFFNTLSNSGTINGTQNTPLALPVFIPLPTFKSAPPGTLDVTVPNGTVQTIAAGNYRDIKVLNNATLRIDQGVSNVRSITMANGGKLLFLNLTSGPTEVRVAEQMTIGNGFVVGPVDSDPLKAGKIVFYVASASMRPVAVDTGNGGTLFANVYAPNGTLILDNGTNAIGAFLAKNVDVQNGTQVALESFFTQQAPTITSANATTFTVGQAGTFTVTTTGTPTPSIAQGGALPPGVSFIDNGNGTGTLSGTPAAGTGGVYALTFTASNGVLPNAVQNFTLTVKQPPTITSANATTFTVGQVGSFMVTTTGFPTPSIAQGGTLPAGVSFIDNGNGTGTLSGTPAAGTGGVYALTFTASNGAPPNAVQNFTLTVNQAPAITSANATAFTVGQAGSFTVTTTGFPTPSIVQGGALPAGVGFVDNGNGTGTLSGTPAAGTGGVYPLTFTASNGVLPNAVQNFTLSLNDPPAAANDGPSVTDANATLSRTSSDPDDLLANDYLGFPLATITSFGGGSLGGSVTSNAAGSTATFGTGGSLTVLSDGGFTFTPSAGFTGVFTFQYRITNAAGSSDATVTIHVRPRATADTFGENVVGNVLVDTSTGTAFSVLANDVFNGPVTVTLVGAGTANGGALTLNGTTGTFVYNPPVGFEGADSFTYTITDASGFTSAQATVNLTVSGMIWFVNNNAGSCVSDCDGRKTNPFTTLQSFTSVNDGVGSHPADNDNVFVHESATAYTFSSGTLLRTGQKLIGQDATASLATIAGVSLPSGSTLPAMNTGAPATTIGSTVSLAPSSTVRGLTISTGAATGLSGGVVSGVSVSEVDVITTTGTAVAFNGTDGTVTLRSVAHNGNNTAIALTNTGPGTFSVVGTGAVAGSGGTIQNIVGADAITLDNTAGPVVLKNMIVQDISAATDATDAHDTRSGVDAISGVNVNGGLTLDNTTIRRISDNAIFGGTFGTPDLATVWNGLTIANSTIEDTNRFHVTSRGDANNEGAVRILGIRGTVNVTNSLFQRGAEFLDFFVTAGTLGMTVTGSQFLNAYKEFTAADLSPVASVGNHGVDVTVQGSANASVVIGDRSNAALGNTFLNGRFASLRVVSDAGATGAVSVTLGHNTFRSNDHSSGVACTPGCASADFDFPQAGVLLASLGTTIATFDAIVDNNLFDEATNASGGAGQLTLSMTSSVWQALVTNNTFRIPGNAPWFVRADGNPTTAKVKFLNNTGIKGFFNCPDVSCGGGYDGPGLRTLAVAQGGGTLDLTIDGDDFAEHDTGFDAGQTFEGQALNVGVNTLCMNLQNNAAPDGYSLEQFDASQTVNVFTPGGSGTCTAPGSPGNCQNALNANNNTGGSNNPNTTPPFVNVVGTVNVVAVACQEPSLP
jgi:hypothetical protein